jgi:hypothetical protein
MSDASAGKAVWSGRILSGLLILFLGFDAVAKILLLGPVKESSAQMGIEERTIVVLGIVLLIATVLYAIPRTAAIGATLVCAYLGGAIATHVLLKDIGFPIIFAAGLGVLVWVGLVLRDRRLRVLLPWA